MTPKTKTRILWTIAAVSGAAALGLAVLAVVLIKFGAYPPAGTGSLGHVGAVVAGIVAAFLGLFCAGLVLVCASKVKAIAAAQPARADPR